MEHHPDRPYRSLFWPVILIGIGLLWLLSNLGAIAHINLPVVVRLWPLMLIFVGLDILLGRRSPVIGAGLGALAVILVIGFLVGSRTLGLSATVQIKDQVFSTPINSAISADVLLAFSDSPVSVYPLPGSSALIDAKLRYVGTINFQVSGTQKKSIKLARNEADFLLFSPLYWDPSLNWQIGLTTRIPLNLTIVGGSGESHVDFSQLLLDKLKIAMGSGSSHFTLPESTRAVSAQVEGGSGAMSWIIPEQVALTMQISGGSGMIDVQLPSLGAVRLDIRDSGSGKVEFPSTWVQVLKESHANEGTWESPGYAQASHKIDIIITHVGSGNIHLG